MVQFWTGSKYVRLWPLNGKVWTRVFLDELGPCYTFDVSKVEKLKHVPLETDGFLRPGIEFVMAGKNLWQTAKLLLHTRFDLPDAYQLRMIPGEPGVYFCYDILLNGTYQHNTKILSIYYGVQLRGRDTVQPVTKSCRSTSSIRVLWYPNLGVPPGGLGFLVAVALGGLLTCAACRTPPRDFFLNSHEFCNTSNCFSFDVL